MSQINESEYPTIIQEFMAYKITVQGCSLKTVEEYMLDLRTFFRYYLAVKSNLPLHGENLEKMDIRTVTLDTVKQIKPEDIYAFLLYSGRTRGNQNATKARKLSALKAFFKYCVSKRRYFDENPTANIESPKLRKALPKFLSEEESVLLLETVKNSEDNKNAVRDFAIITLFLNCGMRVSELCGIDLTDMDPEMKSLRVLGKGNKERIIYLNDACRDALLGYIQERLATPTHKAVQTKALFLSSRGDRISVKTVQWLVYKYLDMAGLGNRHLSVHKLRHTAATLLYRSGKVDVRVLKDILGHEQLNTTQIYTHVSNASMEQAMSENPLSKIKKNKL